MTIDRYITKLLKGRKVILLFLASFLFLSVLYGIFLFEPAYVSQSKVLIEEPSSTTFVTDLGQSKKLETNSMEKNPILTQIEILSSYDMAERVHNALIQKNIFKPSSKKLENDRMIAELQKSIKLKTPPATDIIEVTVSWHNAQLAYQIAQTYLDEYQKYNIEINKQSVAQVKTYIGEQLGHSRDELNQIRNQIKTFRKNSASIDLQAETSNIVQQRVTTENTIAEMQSRINYYDQKVHEYASKLHVPPNRVQKVLDSVALGQNENLNNLNKELIAAEQQYATLKVRYPDSTKKMMALNENIGEIKKQIKEQVALTVGNSITPNDNMVIKDSIRTKVVGDIIDGQSERISLSAQKRSLLNHLNQLKAHQYKIPDQQRVLTGLLERESNLASIVGTLNSKLVEANVRESEIVSNVNVVQLPTFPHSQSFPTMWQIVIIMGFLGALTGCLTVLGNDYLQDKAADISELESLINAPVLGTLSWIPEKLYQAPAKHQQLLDPATLEYQHIVTTLKIKLEDDGINVIGFSNLGHTKSRSSVIASIAKLLSDCKYSVLLIDADFRYGTVAQEFGMNHHDLPDFTNLLMQEHYWSSMTRAKEVAYAKGTKSFVESPDPLNYVVKLENENSLYLMSNSGNCKNPYQVVTSKFFPLLIEKVKEDFDFVLVDMPSILEISDSLIVSRLLDGVIPICGFNSSRKHLKAVQKICSDNVIKMIGAIVKTNNN